MLLRPFWVFLTLIPLVSCRSPQKIETCFSPEEPCEERLLAFLRSAEKSIDMAVYQFNLESVAQILVDKSKRIGVRIVADRDKSRKRSSLIPRLRRRGIIVRFGRQENHQHNKFAIVDGVSVETGSFNFSHNAARRNQENQVYLHDPATVRSFKKRFEKMWAESEP